MAEITLKGEVGVDITLYKTVAAVKQLGEIEQLRVNITSEGGSSIEGRQIFDYLKSLPYQITTNAVGYCYSAALTVFFAGDKRLAEAGTEILMHSPLYFGIFVGGDEEVEAMKSELTKEKRALMQLYSTVLGITEQTIETLMDKDEVIDTETALALGIIHEITTTAAEPVAYKIAAKGYLDENHKQLLIKNQKNMDTKELTDKLEKHEGLMSKILGFVEKTFTNSIKALTIATEEGETITFEGEELVEGVAVTSDTPDGTYTLEYNEKKWTVVIENKIVKTITEIVEEEPAVEDDVEALKAEIERLKAENAELQAVKAKQTELEKTIESIKAIHSKFEKPDGSYEFKAEGADTEELTPEAKAKAAVQAIKDRKNK